jgi:hypothetical protein
MVQFKDNQEAARRDDQVSLEIRRESLLDGLARFAAEYDSAQKMLGDERRQAEAMASARLRGWICSEFPTDQAHRVAPGVLREREARRACRDGGGL